MQIDPKKVEPTDMTSSAGADPGFLERGGYNIWKRAHTVSAEGAKHRAGGLGKNLKIQVLICVFLASGYKIPRLS
jgi:hypothetical protein